MVAILYNFPTGKPLSEADVRFGIIDPILKGIMGCTDTVVATEESVSKSELPRGEQPQPANQMSTQQGKNLRIQQ